MSGYSESALLKKLAELKISAPSIQVKIKKAKFTAHVTDIFVREWHCGSCTTRNTTGRLSVPGERLECPRLNSLFHIFRYRHLVAAQSGHKLTLLYLANDVVQNCRKKQPEIEAEFGLVMKKVQIRADWFSLIIPTVA